MFQEKLGEIELPLDKSGKKAPNTIWENYIYRLTETEAPTGYAKRTEPYYFVRTKTTNIWDWNGYASLTNVEKNALHKIRPLGLICEVHNQNLTYKNYKTKLPVF